MAADDPENPAPPGGVSAFFRKGLLYTGRASLLKCPVCGTKPVFLPLSQTRNLHGWFTPLDGCPRCGYAYEREPGYFLLATWGVNYGVIALLGLTVYILSTRYYPDMSVVQMMLWLVLPIPFLSLLFARHSKAYFLALDHFFDPHVRPSAEEDDGDGGGDQPKAGSPPPGRPTGRQLPDDEPPLFPEKIGRTEPRGVLVEK